MITCKEIDNYLAYCKEHPKWINRDRKLLIKNIARYSKLNWSKVKWMSGAAPVKLGLVKKKKK